MPNGIQEVPAQARSIPNPLDDGSSCSSGKPASSTSAMLLASGALALVSVGLMGKAVVSFSSYVLKDDNSDLYDALTTGGGAIAGFILCVAGVVTSGSRIDLEDSAQEGLDSDSNVQEAQARLASTDSDTSSISSGTAQARVVNNTHHFEMVVQGENGDRRIQLNLESLDSIDTAARIFLLHK